MADPEGPLWTRATQSPTDTTTFTPTPSALFATTQRTALDATDISSVSVSLSRLDPHTGAAIWTRELDGATSGGSLIDCGPVVVLQSGAVLRAFASTSGDPRWAIEYDDTPAALACSDALLVATLAEDTVDVRDSRSGRHRWTASVAPWRVARLVAEDRRVFGLAERPASGTEEPVVGVFDLTRPSAVPRWQRLTAGGIEGVTTSGRLAIGSFSAAGLQGIDLRAGATRCSVAAPSGARLWIHGARIEAVAGDAGVVSTTRLTIDEPAAGTRPWTATIHTAEPVQGLAGSGRGAYVLARDAIVALDLDAARVRWTARIPSGATECALLGVVDDVPLATCATSPSATLIALRPRIRR